MTGLCYTFFDAHIKSRDSPTLLLNCVSFIKTSKYCIKFITYVYWHRFSQSSLTLIVFLKRCSKAIGWPNYITIYVPLIIIIRRLFYIDYWISLSIRGFKPIWSKGIFSTDCWAAISVRLVTINILKSWLFCNLFDSIYFILNLFFVDHKFIIIIRVFITTFHKSTLLCISWLISVICNIMTSISPCNFILFDLCELLFFSQKTTK